jgi:hypothetical protein
VRCSDSWRRGSPPHYQFSVAFGCRVVLHALHRQRAMHCRPYPLMAWLHRNEGLFCFLFAHLCSLHVCSMTPHPIHQLLGILSPTRASPGPRTTPEPGHRPSEHLHMLPPSVPHQPSSTSMRTSHFGHPSASSPLPRASQPLRGPHRPPRRLPRLEVHLYCHCSPLLTHATADGLTGEDPSSLLPPNGFPISLCRSCRRPRPAPPPGIVRNWPAPPPVALELTPLPLSTMGHQSKGGRQLRWAGQIGPRVNSNLYSFLIYLFESISNLVQTQ